MNKDRETAKLVAAILGNISAIAAGIALFEKSQTSPEIFIALIFACMAVFTIRSMQ